MLSLRAAIAVGSLACLAGMPGAARAITCYEIVDESDRTLYRATVPPFPMAGAQWGDEQARLRAKRQQFLWFDTASCPEEYFGPAYTASRETKDASDILSARGSETSRGIYAGPADSAPTAAGRAPGYVAPRGGRVALPVGGSKGSGN